jgi:hypothetical protein
VSRKNIYTQSRIFEHVGNEPGDRGFVFEHKNTGAGPGSEVSASVRDFD